MKKLLLLTMFFVVTAWWANAQISQGGTPPSFKYNLSADVDRVELTPLSYKQIEYENSKYPKDGRVPFIGYTIATDLSTENAGTWTELPEGGRVWRLQIKAPSALALVVNYDNFYIPYGGKLFLYNEDKTQVIGAFTYENNDDSKTFATQPIYGDIVCLEYYEPERVISKPSIHIHEIGYMYRGFALHKNPSWTEPSESCEVNINCSPVGDNWQDEKKGVCRILVKIGSQYGYCSGSLINNTNQDCTPYLLSAYHCYEGASASDLNYWQFDFNYEASGCTTPTTEPSKNTMTGCTLKAYGSISGGSDFLLLQLKQSVPTNYNPYMNGWDRTNTAPSNGVCIHHPAGSIKKISTYNSATTSTYTGAASSAHWRVVWTQNANGWGVTEGGSSGSPLFNSAGNIVGTLTGGSSNCYAQTSPDYYGKMYYHWDMNGSTSSSRLKDWLDPTNSGVTSLSGKNCGSGGSTLNADFVASATTVVVGQTVTFTSTSSGSPTTYSWNFGSGASPATSTSAGPVNVTYSTTGLKTVSLTVGDGTTTDTETKTNYINVVNEITGCDTMHYPLPGTLTIYGEQNGGYVSGNNSYGDLAKADYFTGATNGWKISDVYIYFGIATGSSSQVPVKIWNDNGTGNSPSTVLGTVNVALSSIVSDVQAQAPTLVHFNTPVTIDGSFFVGVVLPTVAGDTVAIVTNTDGDTNPGTAWEQWSDNVWYEYSNLNSWGLNVQHAIWPIVCNPTNIETSAANSHVSIFPNPANDKLNMYFGNYNGEVQIDIYDLLGKQVYSHVMNVNALSSNTVDISKLKAGMYIIQGKFGEKLFNERLQIIK